MSVFHVVSCSGGKDSDATLDLALRRFPKSRVIAIFCDTGNEHALVYSHLEYLESRHGITIVRLMADFAEDIARKRMYIARDVRTRREYDRVPRLDASGRPVYRRTNAGEVELREVKRDGKTVLEPVPRMKKAGGRRVRWSNKAKRRALETLHPSGNPFLDLCMLKGRFPSRKAQFCTQELKTMMAVAFQLELVEQGHRVVSWQGVRRDESLNRAKAKLFERIAPRLYAYRPLVEWSAVQVFAHLAAHDVQPNELYRLGMSRVGCMPCINVNKGELREIAARWPEEIDRIAEWEARVGRCSKHGYSTFMTDAHPAKDRRVIFAELMNIRARVEWSKTSRGGKQIDLFADAPPAACSSAYGLCE
ncbi:phosphoadenosine phosphosulfate reductase domain-containing protein [Rubrivivax gelatinosus]|uniref:Phosphoadenosine phosphosulfate reductase family protein n=1 Tax=Rubrivivax gelatinosus TaxID=28068 RepID=A0A4R2MR86_RUBGE|nr:phosphoadenosine phosphosulfate reductase family protein [Rubrivivax gelatinosus]MBK1686230.1 phosphoadenosine phosphosulfate reductase [Rubrivivax gelatinosus]TCP05726.1 phosphoadenosine phosphosulfate reductase family protein [Rubrivivax gelatinosus]